MASPIAQRFQAKLLLIRLAPSLALSLKITASLLLSDHRIRIIECGGHECGAGMPRRGRLAIADAAVSATATAHEGNCVMHVPIILQRPCCPQYPPKYPEKALLTCQQAAAPVTSAPASSLHCTACIIRRQQGHSLNGAKPQCMEIGGLYTSAPRFPNTFVRAELTATARLLPQRQARQPRRRRGRARCLPPRCRARPATHLRAGCLARRRPDRQPLCRLRASPARMDHRRRPAGLARPSAAVGTEGGEAAAGAAPLPSGPGCWR